MKIEDIIEGLNVHIESRRKELGVKSKGHLVLQRTITPNPTFKAYKLYEMTVWFVQSSKKKKILSLKQTVKLLDGQEEKINKEMGILLCTAIFQWIRTENYNQILMGEI